MAHEATVQQVTDVITVWSFLPSITTVQTHSNMKTICYGKICIRTFFLKNYWWMISYDHINKWFHVALNLLSERSQMMFTCKNKKVAQGMIFWSSSETVWGEDITGVTWLLHAQVIVTAGFKPFTLTILAVVIKMNEYVQDYSELTVIRTQTVVK